VVTPGFDGKTALVIVSGIVLSSVAALIGLRRRAPGARAVLAAMAVALVLFVADMTVFLDRDWYLEAIVLVLLLFWQQARFLRDAQQRRARLELELLKQQIQPHFLMNSLTALTEWVESDPAVGVRMIEALAQEFRSISSMTGAATVSMAQELELCRLHLRVMSLRQNQPFELRADHVRLDAPVPPAIFHTLVENALSHNHYTDGAVFLLEEETAGPDRRIYRLRTPLKTTAPAASSGKGHHYVRARLRDVFGEHWQFSSGPQSSGEWLDSIEVPAR
jgi:LytS/YehU family sensor histidine kinase